MAKPVLNRKVSKQVKYDEFEENDRTGKKSVVIAYLLWSFGGIIGLHHLYLRRDGHAFIWCCSLGGCFGIGWLLEIFEIPTYVREFNEDVELRKQLLEEELPPFSWRVLCVQLLTGFLFGQVCMLGMTKELRSDLEWCIPLAISLGVWLGGNIGRECGNWWQTGLASVISYFCLYGEDCGLMVISMIATGVFTICTKRWRRHSQHKWGFLVRFMRFTTALTVYLCLWLCYICFNARTECLPEEIAAFLQSKWWASFKLALKEMWDYGNTYGFRKIFEYDEGFGLNRNYELWEYETEEKDSALTFNYNTKEHSLDSILEYSTQFILLAFFNMTIDEMLAYGENNDLFKVFEDEFALNSIEDYARLFLIIIKEVFYEEYEILLAMVDYVANSNLWLSFQLTILELWEYGKTCDFLQFFGLNCVDCCVAQCDNSGVILDCFRRFKLAFINIWQHGNTLGVFKILLYVVNFVRS